MGRIPAVTAHATIAGPVDPDAQSPITPEVLATLLAAQAAVDRAPPDPPGGVGVHSKRQLALLKKFALMAQYGSALVDEVVRLRASRDAVLHQLEHGDASTGDLRDIRCCAQALRGVE